jgi:hypothetical protein
MKFEARMLKSEVLRVAGGSTFAFGILPSAFSKI